ncbi:hypothetical protein [Desulforamulus aquiferis]|uniref:Uncharacterized protein n=1 Tax=Desulforamulus aquiferis TaxID=1397668 RepID=A0AAW7Z8H5_9FIRM|nr:hypothetical protein [Desulforamulus aquiferis]MDO7785823.1 hypothetical protein [Desulforamulus aquiferis]
MGLLNFLFGDPAPRTQRVNVDIELPETQYEALMVLMKAAKEKNKDFTEGQFWGKVVTEWLEKNWGPTVKKMAYIDKPSRKGTRKR